jgi:hypothetical protein
MPTNEAPAEHPPKTPSRRRPLQTLSSTVRRPTPRPPTPTPPPSNSPTALANLNTLNEIVVSELAFWMDYLKALPALDFSSLTANEASPETRTKALIYILETLPTRHQALASIYRSSAIAPVVLPGECSNLLASLRSEESVKGIVGADHEKKLFTGKQFRPRVLALEEEVKKLEEERMQELKGLMQMVAMLRLLGNGGLLGDEEVELLAEAMNEAGLGIELSNWKPKKVVKKPVSRFGVRFTNEEDEIDEDDNDMEEDEMEEIEMEADETE